MKYPIKALLLIIPLISCFQFSSAQENIPEWKSTIIKPFEFKNSIPDDCPFKVKTRTGIIFTGRFINYTNADTWYPSWAENDTLYSPWTDGYLLRTDIYEPFVEEHPGYACNSVDYLGRKAATAQAAIVGNDPLNLQIINLPPRIDGDPAPFQGRYPCGSLVYNGNWYYGTYSLTNSGTCGGVGWTEFGPFVGFRISKDCGKTWTEPDLNPANPLFGENPAKANIKIGSPHFVDFGKNMKHSPDGYAYLVAHGSEDSLSCNNWIQGDNIFLIRVKPDPESVNNQKAYEYFAGHDKNKIAQWTSDFSLIKPLLDWNGKLGCVTVTYNLGLKKYMMCISRGYNITSYGENSDSDRFDTMILMSDNLTGEWKIVTYWEKFGPVAYFVNIPSKFISKDGKSMWLTYSANFHSKRMEGNPKGSFYSLSMHEITIK
jgi:hypothetical protein